MNRRDVVLAYRIIGSDDSKNLHCLACDIYNGERTNGMCWKLFCESERFDNRIHEAVITIKGCNLKSCNHDCLLCVMYLKFGVTRKVTT